MTLPFTHLVRLPDGTDAEQIDTGNYYVDFHLGGTTLVITFENRDYSQTDPTRFAWGFDKLRRLGHSVMGVKIKRNDWYLKPDLRAFFELPSTRDLVSRFNRVLLYGSSMGGCGALRFAMPGSEVLAFNPQTTLDPRVALWDERYPDGKSQDWSSPEADAVIGARTAKRVFVAYDPLFATDRIHVDRLDPTNLVRLKYPLVGHTIPAHLAYIGALEPVLNSFLEGTLSVAQWAALIRKRRNYSHYYLTMALATDNRRVAERCIERAAQTRPVLSANIDMLAEVAARHQLWEPAAHALDLMLQHAGGSLGDSVAANRIRAALGSQVNRCAI